MSKRKKKSRLHNDFTDALNVEISERKIIERTQPAAEKVSLEKLSATVEPVTEKISATVESAAEKISETAEIEVPPTVEVKAESPLEERILKEADNDFFDEKPAAESPHKSIFRSKGMQRWQDEQAEKKSPPKIEPPKINKPHKMSHAEKIGVIISAIMLVYALANFDKPLFFLAASLFVHFLCMPVGALFGKNSAAVQNSLRTFSIVLFCGALFFLFTD